MKKYIFVHIILILLGAIFGYLIWIYLLINPLDKAEYDMFVYYFTNENKVEQTFLSEEKENVSIIIDYYNQRNVLPEKKAKMKKGGFFDIPLTSQVKVIDTLDLDIVKIEVLYKGIHKDYKIVKGYIPLQNLHKHPPR